MESRMTVLLLLLPLLLLQQLPVVLVPSCSSSSPAAFHDACLLVIIRTPLETIPPFGCPGKQQGRGGRRWWRRYRRRERWGGLRWESFVRMGLIWRKARLLLGKAAVTARKNRLLLRLRLRGDGGGPGILLQVRRGSGAGSLGGVAARQRQRVAAANGSPGRLAQTRQLLEALAVGAGGHSAPSVRRGRGRQAENRSERLSALLAAFLPWLGGWVLMDSSRVPMPHPPDRLVALCLLLCRAALRHPFIAIGPSRIGPTCTIGRFGQDLP